jgi:hypothetical protein
VAGGPQWRHWETLARSWLVPETKDARSILLTLDLLVSAKSPSYISCELSETSLGSLYWLAGLDEILRIDSIPQPSDLSVRLH